MQDSEVHSLILERLNEIEDEDIRSFLLNVLRHERKIVDNPRGRYKEKYESLVEEYVDADGDLK